MSKGSRRACGCATASAWRGRVVSGDSSHWRPMRRARGMLAHRRAVGTIRGGGDRSPRQDRV